MSFQMDSYVDVASRIVEFRTKHPEGSLQPADLSKPFEIVTIGQDTFVAVVAAAYRADDDPRPGIGMAYERFPGKTPYTRDSELQNAETSAWGRAIMAALAADARKGIASQEEVRNRQADRDQEQDEYDPVVEMRATIKAQGDRLGLSVQELTDDFAGLNAGLHIGSASMLELMEYRKALELREPADA